MVHIAGTVFDPALNIDVQDASVVLLAQTIVDGTWSTSFSKQEETTTDASGAFKFDLEFDYNPAFKLEVEKTDYFDLEYEIPTADFVNGTSFTKSFEMYPKGYVSLNIVNVNPVDSNDVITLRFKDWETSCSGCCFSGFFEFTGDEVNETYECAVYGEDSYMIEYFVTKKDLGTTNYSKNFDLDAFQQANISIEY